MSRTYVLACHKCRSALWVGQGDNGKSFDQNGYVYTTPGALNGLSSFLANHQGHHLEFNNDDNEPIASFELMDGDGEIIGDRLD